MTIYSFGDILLVPFPFTDQTLVKKRPTVIISSDKYNIQKPDLIIMAITSQFNTSINFGEMIIADWKSAGLLKPSVIKPVITTTEKSLIIRKLGKLKKSDRNKLEELMDLVLG
ncbi:type II toxin-antitoxin system PemK/MazF family toxin [Pleurocapsa sp. FMAR1]|uniref:type II toxin-antitoxin system PemK/MazF family toxin n=1 Tax=Pleurocapsa sp. FMAR1 TaxID=3040204 RepID=UPI0029C8BE75|nr:type II toxin-antitoxin system PemK/MazF family toxin [Pleurocapsa sp. FMAR1]